MYVGSGGMAEIAAQQDHKPVGHEHPLGSDVLPSNLRCLLTKRVETQSPEKPMYNSGARQERLAG